MRHRDTTNSRRTSVPCPPIRPNVARTSASPTPHNPNPLRHLHPTPAKNTSKSHVKPQNSTINRNSLIPRHFSHKKNALFATFTLIYLKQMEKAPRDLLSGAFPLLSILYPQPQPNEYFAAPPTPQSVHSRQLAPTTPAGGYPHHLQKGLTCSPTSQTAPTETPRRSLPYSPHHPPPLPAPRYPPAQHVRTHPPAACTGRRLQTSPP
jgi:hypothetical protein